MRIRALGTFYGHFAAAFGTCIFVALPVAHWLPIAAWEYLYGFPIIAAAYATFRTAAAREATVEELYLEIARRERRTPPNRSAESVPSGHSEHAAAAEGRP